MIQARRVMLRLNPGLCRHTPGDLVDFIYPGLLDEDFMQVKGTVVSPYEAFSRIADILGIEFSGDSLVYCYDRLTNWCLGVEE